MLIKARKTLEHRLLWPLSSNMRSKVFYSRPASSFSSTPPPWPCCSISTPQRSRCSSPPPRSCRRRRRWRRRRHRCVQHLGLPLPSRALRAVQVSSFDRERQHSHRQWCENLTVPPSIINRHGSFQIPPIRIYVSLHNSEERLHVKCYMSYQFLHSFTTLTTYWRGWIFSIIWIRSSPIA